jgi:hypothetical protein
MKVLIALHRRKEKKQEYGRGLFGPKTIKIKKRRPLKSHEKVPSSLSLSKFISNLFQVSR